MTSKELAALLNGREYRKELQGDEGLRAKAAGLVIVYGASDDLMELEGAISDELGAYEGTTAYITPNGLLVNECEDEDCPHFERLKARAATIEALWCAEDGYSWTYLTAIPHETFEIVEDGEPYCRGIVFALKDVPHV